jgi:hypothetical protein
MSNPILRAVSGTDVIPISALQVGIGSAILDFGAAPGSNTANVVITGQANILPTSQVEAWLMVTSTADHNIEEHAISPIALRCGNIVPGTGFTIYANTEWRLTHTFQCQWRWN